MSTFFESFKRLLGFSRSPSPNGGTASDPTHGATLHALVQAIDQPLHAGDLALAEARCRDLEDFLHSLETQVDCADTRKILGAGYSDLGCCYREMRCVPEAEAAYAKAEPILESLTSSVQHAEFAHSQIAACHNHLGLLYLDCGPLDEAALSLERAIALRQTMQAKFPENRENLIYLGGALCNRGHVAREMGEIDKALESYHESITTIESAIPHCDCGCRDSMASALSQALGHPHWIMLGHAFRRNAEAGRALITGEAITDSDSE